MDKLKSTFRQFAACERGTASLEFVLVFPIFFAFFLMTFESGMVSLRHVMLERGVDVAVREVRIGVLDNPTRIELRDRICEIARIIPDCGNQLQLEMMVRDPRNFATIAASVPCIDRSVSVQPVVQFTNGAHNQLVVLRACVRLDPFMPTTGLGKAVVDNTTPEAAGSYALVSTAAFVIEPPIDTGSGGSGGGSGGGTIGDGSGDGT